MNDVLCPSLNLSEEKLAMLMEKKDPLNMVKKKTIEETSGRATQPHVHPVDLEEVVLIFR